MHRGRGPAGRAGFEGDGAQGDGGGEWDRGSSQRWSLERGELGCSLVMIIWSSMSDSHDWGLYQRDVSPQRQVDGDRPRSRLRALPSSFTRQCRVQNAADQEPT